MLELRNCVEFALAIHLSVDVSALHLGRLKASLYLLDLLLDSLFVFLRVIPLDDSFIQLPLHVANTSMVLRQQDLVPSALNYILLLHVLLLRDVS